MQTFQNIFYSKIWNTTGLRHLGKRNFNTYAVQVLYSNFLKIKLVKKNKFQIVITLKPLVKLTRSNVYWLNASPRGQLGEGMRKYTV